MGWAERSTGIFADHHQFLSAHMFGRIDRIERRSRPTSRPDRGASGIFHVEDDPGHHHILGAALTALVLAQVEC
jgi:hypothetical protein